MIFKMAAVAAILDFQSTQLVLAILCLLGAPMLLIKFQFNWIIVFKDVQSMNSHHFSYIIA